MAKGNWKNGRSDEDPKSTIANSIEKKIEIKEAEDIKDRTLLANGEKFKTNLEGYNQEKINVKDDFETTAQYIELANKSFKEKQQKIANIRERNNQFDNDIDSLRLDKQEKNSSKEIHERNMTQEITKKLQLLEKERDEIIDKYKLFEKQLNSSAKELIKKNKQIFEIKKQLQYWAKETFTKKQKQEPSGPAEKLLEMRLKALIEKDDEDVVRVLDSLVSELGLKTEDVLDAFKSVKKDLVQKNS